MPASAVSTRQAVRRVVRRSRRPLATSEIIDRVLDQVELRGATPRNTVAARIAQAAQAGEIVHVSRGFYEKPAEPSA